MAITYETSGKHPHGILTLTAGPGGVERGDIVKFSSGKVVVCDGKTDVAIGVALDSAAANEIVPVGILGAYNGTLTIKSAGAITQGAKVTPTAVAVASGDKVATLGTLVCNYVGIALKAASGSGEYIEIAHNTCANVVVS